MAQRANFSRDCVTVTCKNEITNNIHQYILNNPRPEIGIQLWRVRDEKRKTEKQSKRRYLLWNLVKLWPRKKIWKGKS
jgi:hypothetical protein